MFIYSSPRLPSHQHQNCLNSPLYKTQSGYLRPSLPIGTSEGTDAVLLKACEAIEHEAGEGLEGGLVNQSSKVGDNKAYLHKILESESSKNKSSKDESSKDDWLDEGSKCKDSDTEVVFVTASSNWAKEKLVRILKSEVLIPQQRWGLGKILATLAFHQKDLRLHTTYRQFRVFAYHTLLAESGKTGRWPQALTHKNCNNMIQCRLQAEMEKRYSREVQRLCKTSAFGTASIENLVGHRIVLKNVVIQAKATAPLLSSLVLSVGPTTSIKDPASSLSNMKLVAILVILCRSAY